MTSLVKFLYSDKQKTQRVANSSCSSKNSRIVFRLTISVDNHQFNGLFTNLR